MTQRSHSFIQRCDSQADQGRPRYRCEARAYALDYPKNQKLQIHFIQGARQKVAERLCVSLRGTSIFLKKGKFIMRVILKIDRSEDAEVALELDTIPPGHT
jgi:hypothetical protein